MVFEADLNCDLTSELWWTGSRENMEGIDLGHSKVVSSDDEYIYEAIVADLGEGTELGTGSEGDSEMERLAKRGRNVGESNDNVRSGGSAKGVRTVVAKEECSDANSLKGTF